MEGPTRTSSKKSPPLNDDVVLMSSNQQQIVPRLVTPVMLLDESHITQELVSDEFLLQLQATQQTTREFDEARDIGFERNRAIREASEAREVEQQQQQQQVTLAQFQMIERFLANQEEVRRLIDDSSNNTCQDDISPPNSIICV